MARWLLFLAVAGALLPTTASADTYAFLVGVGDYDTKQLKPLAYARSDITAFHDVLVESGFAPQNIVLMHDDLDSLLDHYRQLGDGYDAGDYRPEADKIRTELGLLLPLIEPDDTLIVAFAGHGVQFKGEDQSYFCALDANLDDPERETLISFAELYRSLETCPARRKLLLVDACRNDPQSRLSRSRSDVELESVTQPQLTPPPAGLVALFSCAPGQQAFEFPELEHGIFFYHVLQAWRGEANGDDSQLSLDELIDYTKRETGRFARLRLRASQTPRQRGFFEGEWILREILNAQSLTNSIGMQLVLIPSGDFLMGGDQSAAEVARIAGSQESYYEGEHPQHRVRITRPFYMGTYEVTQAEWESVIGTIPSAFSSSGAYSERVTGIDTSRFPVETVTWYDAVDFCNRLSQREGLSQYYSMTAVQRTDGSISSATVSLVGGSGYRLPTEAEWEYACRAGTTTPFHFGTSNNGREANINGNYPYGTTTKGSYLERTTTVGSYAANAFGLYDMHGNVYEWCFDWYNADAYAGRSGTTSDPVGISADEDRRVGRGGSWNGSAGATRSANRFGYTPGYRINYLGFRVVRTP